MIEKPSQTVGQAVNSEVNPEVNIEVKAVPLSIIVPTLNEQLTIETCLSPLQSMRNLGVEVIVSDGGSTDLTSEVAKPLVDELICSEPGRARQMNAGAAVANGKYLLFLHADTKLPSGFSLGSLGEGPLGSQLHKVQWGFFPVKLSGSAWPFRVIETAMNLRSKTTGIGTGDQAMFIQSELFHRVGGFADIPLMEDVEFCRRLKVICRPTLVKGFVVTSSRRWEQQGICRTVLKMWRLRLAYFLGASPHNLVQQYYL